MADALFNAQSVGQLASEFGANVPGFDAALFAREALAGFASRALLERIEWMADCAQAQLASDFDAMADQIEAALPAPLDPTRKDDDFGHFIHAVHGVLAVRHGLASHPDRALRVIHAATRRFSMEFYIRPFINAWPEKALAQLTIWARDENYHVRRLVTEGTRPKLPWAKSVALTLEQRRPLLELLHADPTRYVTRSVANHLNDLSKEAPDVVLDMLADWRAQDAQEPKDLAWMTKHALRTLIKQGHSGAIEALGYDPDAAICVEADLQTPVVQMGDEVRFDVRVYSETDVPVLMDYRIGFARPKGKTATKVFKLKHGTVRAGQPFFVPKAHRLKGGASTFTLHPGTHSITVQVNGRDHTTLEFDLRG